MYKNKQDTSNNKQDALQDSCKSSKRKYDNNKWMRTEYLLMWSQSNTYSNEVVFEMVVEDTK